MMNRFRIVPPWQALCLARKGTADLQISVHPCIPTIYPEAEAFLSVLFLERFLDKSALLPILNSCNSRLLLTQVAAGLPGQAVIVSTNFWARLFTEKMVIMLITRYSVDGSSTIGL
jgi:hypothetical protein